jgi:hypothetical protein
VGRFLSLDPLQAQYPWYTPYQFAGNTPIQAKDVDGLEPSYPYMDSKGRWKEVPAGDDLARRSIPSGHEQFLRNALPSPNEMNEQFTNSLNWYPIVGEVKGYAEGITGKEWFTGRQLSSDERKAAFLPVRVKGATGVVKSEIKQEVKAIVREETAVAKSSAKAEMGHNGSQAASEANAVFKGNFVYRGLSEEDIKSISSGQGINARNLAGQRDSRWISTTLKEETAKKAYGKNGYVKIDLDKVPSEKLFLDKGFPYGNPKANYNIWAKKDQEVLIEKKYSARSNFKNTPMTQGLIKQLEDVWKVDSGIFWKLRQGKFDKDLYNEFLVLLKSISFEDNELISRRAVSLLWYIPLFMEWQKERVQNNISPEEYSILKTNIQNELERILGTP